MPQARLIIYQEGDGRVPLLDWLDRLPRKVQYKCLAKLERLAELGHKLRSPDCDILKSGIWELRIKKSRVNYRILYAFIPRSQNVILLSHGCTKEKSIPAKEMERAEQNLGNYIANPKKHTYQGELIL